MLVAGSAAVTAGEGRVRALRMALVALVLVAGAATSRAAYRELRSSKQAYERIVRATAARTDPGDVILTNVWWFDLVTASLYDTRLFLYVPDGDSARRAVSSLARAGHAEITLVWSREDGGRSLAPALVGSCFEIASSQDVPVRSVRLATARCRTVLTGEQ